MKFLIFDVKLSVNQRGYLVEEKIKRLFRSKKNRMLFGVCGGLGEYFNTDPTIIRLIAVIAGFFTIGTVFLVYLVSAIIIPEENG